MWDRIINWAWVLWISAGLVGAIVFGGPRDVAVKLILFDLLLFVVRVNQVSRRRARAVLVSRRLRPFRTARRSRLCRPHTARTRARAWSGR